MTAPAPSSQPDISTRLRAMPSSLNDACRTMDEAAGEIASLKSQVERMTKALEFYADSKRYEGPNQRAIPNDPYARPDDAYLRDVSRDHGSIARSALSLEDR